MSFLFANHQLIYLIAQPPRFRNVFAFHSTPPLTNHHYHDMTISNGHCLSDHYLPSLSLPYHNLHLSDLHHLPGADPETCPNLYK